MGVPQELARVVHFIRNMLVPSTSPIFQTHVSSQELSDFENLESWTASGGISLPNCRVPTTAIRLGAVVSGIVTLV
jgi:hypothetical protein